MTMQPGDRELLVLAAKAAGEDVMWDVWSDDDPAFWNPLVDDGDALRLAVRLDISLRLDGDVLAGIAHWFRDGKPYRVVGNYRTGQSEAARMLIVRAAAEIGKAML